MTMYARVGGLLALVAVMTAGRAWADATTERVSVGPGGQQADSASGTSNPGRTCCEIMGAAISGNGRFVAFYSEADNLVPNDTNRIRDIFVRDRKLGMTEIASLALGGALAEGFFGSDEPVISP